MQVRVYRGTDQLDALRALRDLAQKATLHPLVRSVAITLTQDCPARDDTCELEALFNAVKHGDPRVPGLKNGLRYVADPRWADYFIAPARMLSMCAKGACGSDCDDHAGLLAALAGAIGFKTGLCAWGRKRGEFTHVYAVAAIPKRAPKERVGMDSTVPESRLGWEPPEGFTHVEWLE